MCVGLQTFVDGVNFRLKVSASHRESLEFRKFLLEFGLKMALSQHLLLEDGQDGGLWFCGDWCFVHVLVLVVGELPVSRNSSFVDCFLFYFPHIGEVFCHVVHFR